MVSIEELRKRLLHVAIRQAELSNGVGRSKNYRLGAVVFSYTPKLNGEIDISIESTGHNSYNSHPLVKFYKYPHIHAETHSIINAGINYVKGCNVLVTRIQKNGKITMAKPCSCCMALMKEAGIEEVYYTDWDGEINCLKVQDS